MIHGLLIQNAIIRLSLACFHAPVSHSASDSNHIRSCEHNEFIEFKMELSVKVAKLVEKNSLPITNMYCEYVLPKWPMLCVRGTTSLNDESNSHLISKATPSEVSLRGVHIDSRNVFCLFVKSIIAAPLAFCIFCQDICLLLSSVDVASQRL